MLLRTADTPSKNQQPGHQHAGMSLRTVDTQSENQKPGHQHADMSLRTAKESVDMSLRTVGLRIKSRGPAFWYVVADCQTKRGSSLSARSGACGSSLDKPTSRNGGEISRWRWRQVRFSFSSLASYLSLHLKNKIARWVHSCSGVGSWEEPLVSEGLWSPEDLGGQQTEQELKEDLWDAVCKANESTRSKSSIRRFGAARVKGVPILDPPTVSSRNVLIREDQPYYIVAGFVKLFPLGCGDYWAHLQQLQNETREPLSFWEWIKHRCYVVMVDFRVILDFISSPWTQLCATKPYEPEATFWILKRQQTVSTNNVAYTTEELFKMGKAQFTKIVSAFEHSMAGSAQEKLRQRSDLGLWWSRLSRRLCKNKGMHCRTRGRQPPVWRTVFRRKGSLSQLSRSVASATQLNKPLIKFCLQRQFVRRPSPPSRVLLRATQWGVSQKLRVSLRTAQLNPTKISHRRITKVLKVRNGLKVRLVVGGGTT